MPITIDGTGTIGGLSAGGLPDLSVTTADIANDSITADKLSSDQTGAQPIYAARAWVNFNGTGTVAIRASGNVTSITDNGVGDYTVNFTTAMADANYAAVALADSPTGSSFTVCRTNTNTNGANTASAFRFQTINNAPAQIDNAYINVAIFR